MTMTLNNAGKSWLIFFTLSSVLMIFCAGGNMLSSPFLGIMNLGLGIICALGAYIVLSVPKFKQQNQLHIDTIQDIQSENYIDSLGSVLYEFNEKELSLISFEDHDYSEIILSRAQAT